MASVLRSVLKIPRLHRSSLAGEPKSVAYFLRTNAWFFFGFTLLLLASTYFLLVGQQGDEVLAINRQRTPVRDQFFIFLTKFGEAIAYLTVALAYSCIRYRSAVFTAGVAITAGIISLILKGLFQQARPLRWFFDNANELWFQLTLFDAELYNNSWAYTSFPSGHAMAAFALYSYVAFNAGRWKSGIGLFCLLIAAGVAFSRMYLLMHFLRDITVGASLGVMVGALMFHLQFRFRPQEEILDNGWLYKGEDAKS